MKLLSIKGAASCAFGTRPSVGRATRTLFFLLVTLLGRDLARAEDRVTLRGGSGIGSIVMTGQVLDWTGETLKLRVEENSIRDLDADRVESVDTVRLPAHVAGIKALAAGRIDDAANELRKALKDDPRPWMRREILAELVRVDMARGDRIAAGTHFLALYESDPTTFWFDRLPLDWRLESPKPDEIATARNWLRPTESQVSQLIGASILLFDPAEGPLAAKRLEQLAVSLDPRIFPLARAQLWRTELREGDVSRGEVKLWLGRLEIVPEPLRGGPRYLLGHGFALAGDPERAAMNWLWLPLVHDQDSRLAAEAEVLAAEQLTRIGRAADAIVLYREVMERFGHTPSSQIAKKALETMAEQVGSRKE